MGLIERFSKNIKFSSNFAPRRVSNRVFTVSLSSRNSAESLYIRTYISKKVSSWQFLQFLPSSRPSLSKKTSRKRAGRRLSPEERRAWKGDEARGERRRRGTRHWALSVYSVTRTEPAASVRDRSGGRNTEKSSSSSSIREF